MNTENLQKILTAYLICFLPDIFVHFHNALLNLLIYSIKDNQIRMLQEQLAAKDTQIIQITSAMESTASALNAAQALHAGTIQRQIAEQSSSRENAAPDDPEQPKQKQGFFSRLFSKKT